MGEVVNELVATLKDKISESIDAYTDILTSGEAFKEGVSREDLEHLGVTAKHLWNAHNRLRKIKA